MAVKRYLVYAFLIVLLGLPSYGQQATGAKCKASSEGCAMQARAGARPRTIVADAGFGTIMLPPGGYPRHARLQTAALATKDTTTQTAAPASPVVEQEESLGEIARRFRAEKKTHHIPADGDE